jgi:uncharacterized protein YndB with AHSA1/START domain
MITMERTIAPTLTNTSRELLFTRVFWAPREVVFNAWTDPEQISRWWGPHDMTDPICDMDVRPGGAWRIVMRSSDGTEYPLTGTFAEIDPPERLVLTMNTVEHPAEWYAAMDEALGDAAHEDHLNIRLIVTFHEEEDLLGKRTTLTIRQRFLTAAVRDAYARSGARQGWGQSLDRLEELLMKG